MLWQGVKAILPRDPPDLLESIAQSHGHFLEEYPVALVLLLPLVVWVSLRALRARRGALRYLVGWGLAGALSFLAAALPNSLRGVLPAFPGWDWPFSLPPVWRLLVVIHAW